MILLETPNHALQRTRLSHRGCNRGVPRAGSLSWVVRRLATHMNILQQIESRWFDSAASAIVSQVASFPSERFYAGAFWLCYVDYTKFGTPCFAMNTESHLTECGAESSSRWSPPNCQFDILDGAVEAMSPLYDALSRSLAGQDSAVWDAAIEEHSQVLARVSRRLTHHARSRTGPFVPADLPANFVVGVFDEREGEPTFSRLVRASIEPEILSALPAPLWEAARV